MGSFCQQFGKRNRFTYHVRAKCVPSDNRRNLVLEFAFSPKVVAIAGWRKGDRIDVSRDGDVLTFAPSEGGRTLHGQPATAKFGFEAGRLVFMEKWFGFPVTRATVWFTYSVHGDRISVRLMDARPAGAGSSPG